MGRSAIVFATTMFKAVCYNREESQIITAGTDRKVSHTTKCIAMGFMLHTGGIGLLTEMQREIFLARRRGGQMVSALHSGQRGPDSSPDWGHYIMLFPLCKLSCPHGASLGPRI